MPPRNRAREARRGREQEATPERSAIWVETPEAGEELAEHLLSPERDQPTVVISTPFTRPTPHVDLDAVLHGVPAEVAVYVLSAGPAAQQFADALPEGCSVRGGASRVYPPGPTWALEPFTSAPLRLAYENEGADVARKLVRDVTALTTDNTPITVWTSETGVDAGADEDDLEAELVQAHQEVARERALREQADADRARLRQELRDALRSSESTSSDTGLFLDPEEQFRFEVYLAWARRVPASSKADHPLADFAIGPEFLASLEDSVADRAKVVDVVVEAVTGLDRVISGRDLHRLRTGEAGNAAVVTREDGAVCWRAAVQRSSPSARRLHYWKVPGGGIELSRVVLHDDMRP